MQSLRWWVIYMRKPVLLLFLFYGGATAGLHGIAVMEHSDIPRGIVFLVGGVVLLILSAVMACTLRNLPSANSS